MSIICEEVFDENTQPSIEGTITAVIYFLLKTKFVINFIFKKFGTMLQKLVLTPILNRNCYHWQQKG